MDVMTVFTKAQDFFNLFLPTWCDGIRMWRPKNVEHGCVFMVYLFMLGMWLFLKLYVFDCGRFLWVDNSTIAKDRFDYARVLLSTSSLEIINTIEKFLVDGMMVELKIIEEWGFSIGEDACLLDDDDESKMSHPDNNLDHEVPNTCVYIAELVNNLADDWEAEEKARHSNSLHVVKPEPKEVGP